MLCEGVPSEDFTKVNNGATYKSLICCGEVSDLDTMKIFIDSKLEALKEDQILVERQYYSICDECEILKQQSEEMIGSLEKKV